MGKVWGPDAVWKNAFTDEYGTGTALAESPLKEGLLFVGTDDGLVQISPRTTAWTWREVDEVSRRARYDLRHRRVPLARWT